MIDKDKLFEYCQGFGIYIDSDCFNKLDLYAHLLIEGNKKCNLTTITAPNDILIKHFLDSLTGLSLINSVFSTNDDILMVDIGSGAGFPGIVLALADKRINLTVIDSSLKRIDFLSELSSRLGLDVDCVHSRAEDAGHNALYRERFDISVSRAVAQLNVLSEYCVPFLKVNGYFLAYKGKSVLSELEASENSFKLLNCSLVHNESFTLPDESDRSLLLYKKTSATDLKYPRRSSKITKAPL